MKLIREERIRQSMTQKRLAFEAGIDARTLRKIEKGEAVSPESMRSVMVVLGISPPSRDNSETTRRDEPQAAKTSNSVATTAAMSLLTACFILSLAASGYTPDFAYFIPGIGLAGLVVAVICWDMPGRSSSSGTITGSLVFCLGVAYLAAFHERLWLSLATVYPCSVIVTGLLLAVPRVRSKLIRMTEAGPDYRWLLFSIGSSWFGIWAITGFHQIRSITYVMISLWGSDLPILPLMISVVGPVVIALSMIPLAFERTKMIGYGLTLISCMILVGRNIHRDGTAALALWEATHEPFNILWSIAACAPHFAMIAICLYQLRRPLARYGERALGLIFVSAHAIP